MMGTEKKCCSKQEIQNENKEMIFLDAETDEQMIQ